MRVFFGIYSLFTCLRGEVIVVTADDEVDDSDLTLVITVVAVVDVDLRQVSSLTHFFFI